MTTVPPAGRYCGSELVTNPVQGDYVGFNTGNEEKLSNSLAGVSISGVECYLVTLYLSECS